MCMLNNIVQNVSYSFFPCLFYVLCQYKFTNLCKEAAVLPKVRQIWPSAEFCFYILFFSMVQNILIIIVLCWVCLCVIGTLFLIPPFTFLGSVNNAVLFERQKLPDFCCGLLQLLECELISWLLLLLLCCNLQCSTLMLGITW